MWIFGYGSLIFRPDLPYRERRTAWLRGFSRRFWQGSPDHRGTAEAPGRVVTLVAEEGARCLGVAFDVAPSVAEDVLLGLDHREKAGYRRQTAPLEDRDGRLAIPDALFYVAEAGNPDWVGEAPLEEIARVVAGSVGPSGLNRDYVWSLRDALRALGEPDPHVEALATLLRDAPVAQ